LQQYLRSIYTM